MLLHVRVILHELQSLRRIASILREEERVPVSVETLARIPPSSSIHRDRSSLRAYPRSPPPSPRRITSPRVRSHLHRHVSRHSLHARLFLFRALEGHLEAHILLFTRGGHDEDAAARRGRGGDARDVGVERARARDVDSGGEHDDEARGVDDVTTKRRWRPRVGARSMCVRVVV